MKGVFGTGYKPLRPVLSLGFFLLISLIAVPLGTVKGGQEDRSHRMDPGLAVVLDGVAVRSAGSVSGSSELRTETEDYPRFRVPEEYPQAGSRDRIALILEVREGAVSLADLNALGVDVQTRAGSILTAHAPISRIPELLHLSGLIRVSAASPVDPMLDVSADSIEAPLAWQGLLPPTNQPIKGGGILVGIVDSGIDLTHEDFKNPDGSTRIRFVWDQTESTSPPGEFNYGREYTQAMIDGGLAASCLDTDGHGTQMAGVAAGNGRGTGNGQPAESYIGMAPEADLIVVKTSFSDAAIIDGVSYIFQKADALGMPAVVNLSVGTQKGGHDGSAPLDEALSALAGPGKIITAAAGNFGDLPIHAQVNLQPGETKNVDFVVPPYTVDNAFFDEAMFFEGWHEGSASFRTRLITPGGSAGAWVQPGQNSGTVVTPEGKYMIDNGTYTSSKGSVMIGVTFWRGTNVDPAPAEGTWTIELSRETGAASGVADFWLTRWTLGTATGPSFSNPDPNMTITSPATGDHVISTGAYITKRRWTNLDGQQSSYGFQILGSIAYFSSRGPRRDGALCPDVVAPGFGVASALSADAIHSSWSQVEDGVHSVNTGTSLANAHTTGAIALILQEQLSGGGGYLSPAQIRDILLERARRDEYTGPGFDPAYGSGKLSLMPSGSTAILDPDPDPAPTFNPAGFTFAAPFPNPSAGSSVFEFTVPAPTLAQGAGFQPGVELVIFDIQGRRVTRLGGRGETGVQRLSWDGTDGSGRRVPAGLYYSRLTVGPESAIRRVVRLD